jgi:hypothetical protein
MSPSGQRALVEFKGEKWTQCKESRDLYGLNHILSKSGQGIGRGFVFTGGGNSGYQAVNLALQWGAAEIILLGYTMMLGANGKAHWHQDHRGNNPTRDQLATWASHMCGLASLVGDRIKVHGESALIAFPQCDLFGRVVKP